MTSHRRGGRARPCASSCPTRHDRRRHANHAPLRSRGRGHGVVTAPGFGGKQKPITRRQTPSCRRGVAFDQCEEVVRLHYELTVSVAVFPCPGQAAVTLPLYIEVVRGLDDVLQTKVTFRASRATCAICGRRNRHPSNCRYATAPSAACSRTWRRKAAPASFGPAAVAFRE